MVSDQSQRLEYFLTFFMLQNLKNILHRALIPGRKMTPIRQTFLAEQQSLRAFGIDDFRTSMFRRERCCSLPFCRNAVWRCCMRQEAWASPGWEFHGVSRCGGKSFLRWSAPRQRNVLYIDGEMPLVSLQERLREISAGFGRDIPNDGFRILAADNVEGGINLSTEEGQQAIEPLLADIDLLILDNLSTLLPSRSEAPVMHGCRFRRGCSSCGGREFRSCLFTMPARMVGNEAPLDERMHSDTVIALRRPEDYSPEQGADSKSILKNCESSGFGRNYAI